MTSKSKNYLIAFLACTTLAGAGLALQQRQLLLEAKAAPTLKLTQSTFAAPPPKALNDAPAAAPAPTLPSIEETSPAPGEGGPGGPPGGGGPGQGRGGQGAQWAARMQELMKDPEFAAAWKIEQEARIDNRYGALFKQLNLPPEKLAALKTLLIERDNANRDVMASAMAEGLNPRENRDQIRELTAQLQAEVDANIKSTLGEAAYAELQNFNSSQPQRSAVNNLNQRLTLAGQPLNSSQSTQLTRILAETGTVSGRSVLITDQTISLARGVLMPAQVDQLVKLQTEQAAQQLIESKTRAARQQPQRNNN